jgi:hypothetical protein
MSVSNDDERDAIAPARRMSGMAVYVTSTKSLYILQPDLETWELRIRGANTIDLTTDISTTVGSTLVWDGQKFIVGQVSAGSFNPNITNLQDGDTLSYDQSTHQWINVRPPVTGFNPTITNPQDGDVIVYDSATGKWMNLVLPAGFTPTITNPQDGDAIRYDSATGKWVNMTIPAGFTPTITSLQNGDVLKYDSTSGKWVNAQPAAFPTVWDMGVI